MKGNKKMGAKGKTLGWHWRNNIAYYDFMLDGKRYKGTTRVRKDDPNAIEKIEAILLRLRTEQVDKYSVKTIWEQTRKRMLGLTPSPLDAEFMWDIFQKNTINKVNENRSRIYHQHVKIFVEYMKEHYPDVKDLAGITREHAIEFTKYIYNGDGANATKNDKIVFIKRLFKIFCHALNLVENPFAIPEIKRLPKQQCDREIFTPEQINLLFTAQGWLYDLFVTALCTFQREGDCCLLKKCNIDLDHNTVRFIQRKTGTKVEIPILPRLRILLVKRLNDETNTSEYVYPELANLYLKSPSQLSGKVKEFLNSVGIQSRKAVEGYTKECSVLDVHSLRHTAAMMAVLNGWPIQMVMQATGHKTLEMVMNYTNHLDEIKKQEYFSRLSFGQNDIVTGTAYDDIIQKVKMLSKFEREKLMRYLASLSEQPQFLASASLSLTV